MKQIKLPGLFLKYKWLDSFKLEIQSPGDYNPQILCLHSTRNWIDPCVTLALYCSCDLIVKNAIYVIDTQYFSENVALF